MKAVLNETVLAASDDTVVVEGNHYFPPTAIADAFFEASSTSTYCPWKGTASYYDVVVDDQRVRDAAWYYPAPMDAAAEIRDHVAFYGTKVTITD